MGLRTRRFLPSLVLASLLCTGSAAALDTPSYGELRELYPQIDRAVSSMPASNLHGSFNRISAQLQSSPVDALPAGSSELVPANVERNLVRAIDRLRERIQPAVEELGPLDQLNLLQTTSLAVFEPLQALYSDSTWEFCPEPGAGCDAPPVLSALDRLAQDLIPLIVAVQNSYVEQAAGDASLPAVSFYPDEAYHSQSFEERIDELADLLGLVHGEPIID